MSSPNHRQPPVKDRVGTSLANPSELDDDVCSSADGDERRTVQDGAGRNFHYAYHQQWSEMPSNASSLASPEAPYSAEQSYRSWNSYLQHQQQTQNYYTAMGYPYGPYPVAYPSPTDIEAALSPTPNSSYSSYSSSSSSASAGAIHRYPNNNSPSHYQDGRLGHLGTGRGPAGHSNYPVMSTQMSIGSGVVPSFSPALSVENDSSNDSSFLELISRANIAAEQTPYGPTPMGGSSSDAYKRGPTSFKTSLSGSSQQSRYHPYGTGSANLARRLEAANKGRDPQLSSSQDNSQLEAKADRQPITVGAAFDTRAERKNNARHGEKISSIQSFIARLDAEDTQTQASPLNKTVGQNSSISIGNDEVLSFVSAHITSPIMAYLCELLANPEQYSPVVSWTPNGLRWEFKVHDTKTFANILNLRFGKPKSYLQIARALKSFEQKDFEGHVTLKKVKDKRNHFQFFPPASDDDGQ